MKKRITRDALDINNRVRVWKKKKRGGGTEFRFSGWWKDKYIKLWNKYGEVIESFFSGKIVNRQLGVFVNKTGKKFLNIKPLAHLKRLLAG